MEPATIARPYAEALFHAVKSKGDLAAWSDWLQKLAQIACHRDFLAFASHPKIKSEEVSGFLLSAISPPNDKQAKNFVDRLISHRRLRVVAEIATQFNTLKNARENAVDATIVSAFSIDDRTLTKLIAMLEDRFGRTLKPQVSIDPSLIGGVRVAIGDEIFDTSVRTQLEKMQTAISLPKQA